MWYEKLDATRIDNVDHSSILGFDDVFHALLLKSLISGTCSGVNRCSMDQNKKGIGLTF